MAPTSFTSLLILLLFVVPGFVHQAVRISLRGRLPLDLELSTRIVRAIVTSGIFGLVYLVALGDTLVDAIEGSGHLVEHPRLGAMLALVGGIGLPAGLALLPAPEWGWTRKLRDMLPDVTKFDFTPTAWDKAFQSVDGCFIRVLTTDDRWIAGFFGPRSYATSYPEPHQLFLEKAFEVSENGTIGAEVLGTRGVIIDCTAIQLVQMLDGIEVGEEESR